VLLAFVVMLVAIGVARRKFLFHRPLASQT
jgi:hypothetical protein